MQTLKTKKKRQTSNLEWYGLKFKLQYLPTDAEHFLFLIEFPFSFSCTH